jgi:hypothetical protein
MGWFIVSDHRRTFPGWTGSLMGCEQKTQSEKMSCIFALFALQSSKFFAACEVIIAVWSADIPVQCH